MFQYFFCWDVTQSKCNHSNFLFFLWLILNFISIRFSSTHTCAWWKLLGKIFHLIIRFPNDLIRFIDWWSWFAFNWFSCKISMNAIIINLIFLLSYIKAGWTKTLSYILSVKNRKSLYLLKVLYFIFWEGLFL